MYFFVSVYEAEFYAAIPSPHTKTKQILINSGAKKKAFTLAWCLKTGHSITRNMKYMFNLVSSGIYACYKTLALTCMQ